MSDEPEPLMGQLLVDSLRRQLAEAQRIARENIISWAAATEKCEQMAKVVDAYRDMALRFAEDRDQKKHESRALASQVATLTEALVSLRNEAAGFLGLGRDDIQAMVGETNVRCLERRIVQADAALAAARGEK